MQEQSQQKRQTAYKVWIGSLARGRLILEEGRFNFVELAGKRIARVNIVATVIDRYSSEDPDRPYVALTIDDASGKLQLKAWGNTAIIDKIQIGTTICAIGWLRYYNNELYILPEIVKELDPKWALVRKLELTRLWGDLTQQQLQQEQTQQSQQAAQQQQQEQPQSTQEQQVQQQPQKSVKEQVAQLIHSSVEGVDIDRIILSVQAPIDEINSVIKVLLDENKIYEPSPGKLRSIE